jgi:hypothetical protein
MAQQARNFSRVVEDWNLACRNLVYNRDTNFAALDKVLKTEALGGRLDHYSIKKAA